MSVARAIALHTFWQAGGKIAGTLLGLVTVGFIFRYLGTAGFGQYTTVMAYLQLFGILVDFGLYMVLIKRISDPKEDEADILNNVFTMRLVSAVVFLGLAPLMSLSIGKFSSEIKLGIAVTTFAYLFMTLIQCLTPVFQKRIATGRLAAAELFGRFVLLAITVIVIRMNLGLIAVLLAFVAGNLANFLLVLGLMPSSRLRLHYNLAVWKSILREAWPIAISISLNLIYFKADTLILSMYRPFEEVGIYGAPYKILEVLITFPTMFVGLVLPLLAAAYAQREHERFRNILQTSIEAIAMMALPLIAISTALAEPLMLLLGGKEFLASAPVLRILIWAVGIIFMGTLFGHLIVVIHRQRPMIWGYAFVAFTALAGYLYFIPRFSYYGAAGMTVYSEAAITTIVTFLVLKTTGVRLSLLPLFKIALASAIVGGALFALRSINLFVILVIGALLYAGLLFLLRVIAPERLKEIAGYKSAAL